MQTSRLTFAFSLAAAAAAAGSVTVKPTGRYMAVPVQNGAPKILMEVFDGGRRVAYDQVEWARGATNWTGSLDLRGFEGRALEFRFSGENAPNVSAADLAFADARFPAPKEQYGEAWRPQFHFTPPLGWNNDPNGLSYRDGETANGICSTSTIRSASAGATCTGDTPSRRTSCAGRTSAT